MRLFLFDVDGTLISSQGVGRRAITHALEQVYGTAGDAARYDFRGKTDVRIVVDLMEAAGIPGAVVQDRLDACFAAYTRELEGLIGDGACVRTMPGIAELVRTLSQRRDALVGLLTGNIARGAELKVRPTGLWPLFPFGAFGSDDMDRRRLPAVARARARALVGEDIPFERITIIGDTPLDVDCARACGAVAVAVATGQYLRDELAACAPDLLFGDFSDLEATLRGLTGR